MKKVFINHMTGQQIVSERYPGEDWCCLGEVETNDNPLVPTDPLGDVDMTVGADFDSDDF